MELDYYFHPVSLTKPDNYIVSKASFGKNIFIHTQNNAIKSLDYQMAIIGVPEDRNALASGSAKAPDAIRAQLYQLSRISPSLKIADFGNLKNGNTIEDSYYALRDVIYELLSHDIIPVIIGGSQDLTLASSLALKKMNKKFNLVTLDSRLDIGKSKEELNANTYLNRIIFEKSMFHYANLGAQSYFASEGDVTLMKKLYFDVLRLGIIRNNIKFAEPYLRDANILSIDISCVKQSDAPATAFPSPNGFYSEEICQLARYAGLSNEKTVFGIYEVHPDRDHHYQTTQLSAQIIWFFIEGYFNRIAENPTEDLDKLNKFIVNPSNHDHAMNFYKSEKSGRWWMEVPLLKEDKEKNVKIISCSFEDYKEACENNIPDRWWRAFQKLNYD